MGNQLIKPEDLKNNDNCARLIAKHIFMYFTGNENETVEKYLIGFGEGITREGSVCGAISGAILSINYILEERGLSDIEREETIGDLKAHFKEKYGSINCGEILESYVGIDELSDQNIDIRNNSCSHLLTDTVFDVNELLNYAISFANPIMRRFNQI